MMLPVWKKELNQGAPCTGQMLSKKPPVDGNRRVETGDGSTGTYVNETVTARWKLSTDRK